MVDAAAPVERAARHRAAQALGAGRQAVAAERAAVAARHRGQHAAHTLELEQLRRRARRAEGDHVRIGGVREHRVGERIHLDDQARGAAASTAPAPRIVAAGRRT